jgi:pilus assembly protein CpaB
MKTARLAVIGVAVVAGLAAAIMASGSKPPEAPPAPPAPVIATEDVLVASHELTIGSILAAADMRWQPWPKANLPEGTIRRSVNPNAIADNTGAVLSSHLLSGDVLHPENLGKGNFMSSTLLTPGMRAVSINIDANGSNTAGGFILPNDHVDVLHTIHDDATAKAGGDGFVTEPLLLNVRVLAIGQTVQEKNNERVVSGTSATLEVTPRQAAILVLAQRVGQLSLILRSMADANSTENQPAEPPEQPVKTIVKYGVALQVQSR